MEDKWRTAAMPGIDPENREEERSPAKSDRMESEVFLRAQEIAEANRKLKAANEELAELYNRERAEGKVREQEARRSAILDAALDGIVTMDHTGRIVDFSRSAERIFGYRAEDVAGKKVADTMVPERFRQQHTEGLAHFERTGEGPLLGHRVEVVGLRADGSEFPVELAISTTRLPGKPAFFTAFLRDLTEQKRSEQALIAAKEQLAGQAAELERVVAARTKELRESVAELEAFTYSLSHDMRAPLRAMQSYSQVVLADCREKLSESDVELLQKIAQGAERLDRLIIDVLAFSRFSREKITVAPVDVEKLFQELVKERPEWQAPKGELVVERPIYPMLGHEASLTQCITNLVDNGMKFVARGNRPQVRIWSERCGEEVRLWFEDKGIGIEKEAQRRLFGMFERVHNGQEYHGTGIGLAIVRKAIERMGGLAGVESEAGKGSRFWLQLKRGDQ